MTDRELLELAAKAAGVVGHFASDGEDSPIFFHNPKNPSIWGQWNPLTDDGDALRLAVKLRIDVAQSGAIGVNSDSFTAAVCHFPVKTRSGIERWQSIGEQVGSDTYAATRRSIVRAAAEIGKIINDKDQEKAGSPGIGANQASNDPTDRGAAGQVSRTRWGAFCQKAD